MIAIVDYGSGNLRSVANALHRLNAEYLITSNAAKILAASHVILPGVGEASSAMQKLKDENLVETIKKLTQPTLGICIGLQLMCSRSDEGNTVCMGIFENEVKKLSAPKLKVPHIGWNNISNLQTSLFAGVSENSFVYYVHSFAPTIGKNTIAVTDYGGTFSAAICKNNFYGTQFHPEKSADIGAKILQNFLNL